MGLVDPRIRSDRMLPPLPYTFQLTHPQQYPYGSVLPPARTLNAVNDPIPTNAFVAKLNMGIEPIVVRELVNSKYSSFATARYVLTPSVPSIFRPRQVINRVT